MKADIVVTRHPALVTHLRELGIMGDDTEVLSHVSNPKTLTGKCVCGVLPLHLAAEARCVINVPLNVPPERRGAELTLEEIREYAQEPRIYEVRDVTDHYVPSDIE